MEWSDIFKYIVFKISFIIMMIAMTSSRTVNALDCVSDLYAEPSYQFKIKREFNNNNNNNNNDDDDGFISIGVKRNGFKCKVLDKQKDKITSGKVEEKLVENDLDKDVDKDVDVESGRTLVITSEADALEKAIELIQDIPCLTFQMEHDVWSYTFCDGEIVQTVSEEAMAAYGLSPTEVENIKYITGRQSEDQPFKLSKRAGDGTYFLQQSFPNGDRKLCAKNRETVIIYSCIQDEEESILSFDEFSICLYHMKIGTPRLCVHPYFKVPVEDDDESSSHILDCSVQTPSPLYYFNYINFMCKGLECLVSV